MPSKLNADKAKWPPSREDPNIDEVDEHLRAGDFSFVLGLIKDGWPIDGWFSDVKEPTCMSNFLLSALSEDQFDFAKQLVELGANPFDTPRNVEFAQYANRAENVRDYCPAAFVLAYKLIDERVVDFVDFSLNHLNRCSDRAKEHFTNELFAVGTQDLFKKLFDKSPDLLAAPVGENRKWIYQLAMESDNPNLLRFWIDDQRFARPDNYNGRKLFRMAIEHGAGMCALMVLERFNQSFSAKYFGKTLDELITGDDALERLQVLRAREASQKIGSVFDDPAIADAPPSKQKSSGMSPF